MIAWDAEELTIDADSVQSLRGVDLQDLPVYTLITPARNEAQFIELTIQAVVNQTARPLKWVIVSDGSTDGTDDIVRQYAAQHDWIELVSLPQRSGRDFAGKVMAINAGLVRVKEVPYDVIACLDADITFGPDYFAFILDKFTLDPRLGLAGTPFRETTSEVYDFRYASTDHVSGACQVFRRACFEEIGGYVAVRGGAIDSIASITARMKGWRTRTFTGRTCFHHRVMGTAQAGQLRARFDLGRRDYRIGNHPLWQLFRCTYQMTKRPFVARGLAVAAGYAWALLRSEARPVSAELVAFRRREQMHRLAEKFSRILSRIYVRRSKRPA